ncbi:PilN domain-containing protein [Desulfogranum marinum]|uniref:PilN domain-containing protein n=1 Tax=Desulfogranum marinum TaxID=453220 RepID=UPI0019638382|nr:PilN domain-containing protein [Desulfogranum marinum]MBM9513591.1 PilN domain-containing protein [Desulfogranum marinum]
MIYINLLPVKEIRRRNKAKKQIFSLAGAFVLVVALLSIFAMLQANTITARNETLADLKKERQRYTAILNKIKQLEQDKQVLQNRIAVIKKLKKSSSLTVHALDEVANITPSKRMWLTTLTQSGGNMKVSGMALDNRTIAKYMDDLKSSPYIQSVHLASSSLKGFAGRNLKAFSISCSIAVPEDKKEPQTN